MNLQSRKKASGLFNAVSHVRWMMDLLFRYIRLRLLSRSHRNSLTCLRADALANENGGVKMARQLNKEQKRLLDLWFEQEKDNVGLSFEMKDLDYDLYKRIESLNDFEAIYSHVTDYIHEKVMSQ